MDIGYLCPNCKQVFEMPREDVVKMHKAIMNQIPLPKEEDDNVIIEQEIMDRLFDERFNFYNDEELNQYNFEQRPYIYPDVE